MKTLDAIAKVLFIMGFLLVCLVGTAPDMPFHLLGLPLCGLGAVMAGVVAIRGGRVAGGGVLPWMFVVAVGYLGWRAWASPVRHLAEMDGFLLAALVCGFAMTWFTGRVRWLEPWLWLVAVLGTGVGLYHVFADDQFTLLRWLNMEKPVEGDRASGFFFNPNPFGTWSAMLLMLAVASFFFRSGSIPARVWTGLAVVAAGMGMLLSFCRAAFVGSAVGIVVLVVASMFAVLRRRMTGWQKTIAVCGVMVVTGACWYGADTWLPTLLEKRGVKSVENAFFNVNARLSYWRTGMSQFLDAPIAGTGSRTFSYLSYSHWDQRFQLSDKDPEYVHNEYIQTLAEYGFTGLVVLLGLLASGYVRAVRLVGAVSRHDVSRDGRARLAWCIGVLGAGSAFLGDVFFSFSGHFAPMVLLCGLMLGGLAAINMPGADAPAGNPPASRWAVGILTIVAAGMLIWPGALYAIASARITLAGAAYEGKRKTAAGYLDEMESIAVVLPRYPVFIHAGSFAAEVASRQTPGEADATWRRALVMLDRALEDFPRGLDARIERALVLEELGQRTKADADFRVATALGEKREYYYRAWMKWGEVKFRRAVDAWNAGDSREACRWLRESRAAYDESKRLGWITRNDLRYPYGRYQVDEMIAFFKRTGEWDGEK